MKTTVEISDSLLREARKLAALIAAEAAPGRHYSAGDLPSMTLRQ